MCIYREVVRKDGSYLVLNGPVGGFFDSSENSVTCGRCNVNVIIEYGGKIEEYFKCDVSPGSPACFVKRINEKSEIVKIENIVPGAIPRELPYTVLQGGRNGVLNLTPADFIGHFRGLDDKEGIGIFESIEDISLICAPDLMAFEDVVHRDRQSALEDIFSVQMAMAEQCERLKNRFAVLDTPHIEDTIELAAWGNRFDTSFAAAYYPYIEVVNPADRSGLSTVIVPPSGHIAGVYAQCDREEGKHRAPANRYIKGAAGLSVRVSDEEYEIVYPRGINCLKYVPGRGTKIWGARTMTSDPEWRYINVRRAFSAISEAIESGTGWAVFEPNNMNLRKRLVRHITAFLLELYRDGCLAGAVPDEAFYIRCDDELNPLENIDNGIITVEVGVAISRPAEYLVVTFRTERDSEGVKAIT
jgi:hypothetical protein